MPPASPVHTVRVFGHDYTVEASATTRAQLDAAARQLDETMRTCQARDPTSSTEQLAVLAALEMIRAAPVSTLNEREIVTGLAALQRKLDRLEAALTLSAPLSSEQSPSNP